MSDSFDTVEIVASKRPLPAPITSRAAPSLQSSTVFNFGSSLGMSTASLFAAKPSPAPSRPAPRPRRTRPKPKPKPRRRPTRKPATPAPKPKPRDVPVRRLPKVPLIARALSLIGGLLYSPDVADATRPGGFYRGKIVRTTDPANVPSLVPNDRRDKDVAGLIAQPIVSWGAVDPVAMPTLNVEAAGAPDLAISSLPELSTIGKTLARPATRVAAPSLATVLQPLAKPFGFPIDRLLNTPTKLKDKPVFRLGELMLPAPQPTPKEETECKCSKPKQKRRKPKDRDKCYRGTFIERKRGTSKIRKEQVPCQ